MTSDAPDGLPIPRRYRSMAAIWLALAMAVLDGAIANVALPTIAADLGASPATSVWVINAYQLTITVLLLPLAALGDKLGYRRVYLPGLVLFTIGSAGCALSHSLGMLIAARVFQGVGAACIMSMNAALVRDTYPARMLGRAIGYNAMVLSACAAAGPSIASLILTLGKWPWLFLINLPIGVAALAIGRKALPDPRRHDVALDAPAGLLAAGMMGLTVFGGELAARADGKVGAALVAAGIACAVLLVRRKKGKDAPLFPLDLLGIRLFRLSIMTSVISFAAQMLTFVALPFLLQSVLGRSVVATGLLMTPWPIALGIAASFSGRLADKVPSGLLGGIGLALMAVALFALAHLGSAPSNFAIGWRMALAGLGFGLFQSPNNRTIVATAPRRRSGAAGGMLATARLTGQTIGAVTVAAAFHLAGVKATPTLFLAASIASLAAAAVSLLRLGEQAGAKRAADQHHAALLD
ncbi:MFS transporter [Sphingomonas sp. ASV193]|uniref:MFS transporter n=1 Tax=Sphingomonas sp. ASV193 TaxID=3144405 RepID=UPI0032E87F0E